MPTKTNDKKPTPEAQLRALIAKFDAKTQTLIRSVRSALRKRFPTANELVYDYSHSLVVGYSPSQHGIESIVSFAVRDDGVSLYFNKGPQLPDPKKLLMGSAKQVRFVQLESAKRVAHPDVEALIAAAIGLSSVPLPSTGEGALIIKTSADKKMKSKPKRKK